MEPWTLEADSVFKLSFGIVDTASDEPFVPQHAHVRFTDAKTAATTLQPVTIKGKGKAKFDLVRVKFCREFTDDDLHDLILISAPFASQKSSSIPAALRASTGTHTVTILLGHPSNDIRPLEYTIGTITLPSSRLLPLAKSRHDLSVKKAGEPAFVVQPEIQWTFGQPEKTVSKGISAIGTGIVIGLPLAVWALTVSWK